MSFSSERNTRLPFGEYVIRSWCDADVEPLQRYANNRKIWLNLRDVFPHPYTIEDARWWIEHASQEDPERSFAIASAEEPIGSIGLIFGDDVHRCNVELGYWLAESFWGRGIMTGAVRTLTGYAFKRYAFKKFPLNRIYAEPFAHNLASVRVLEKAGFLREGVLRASVVKDGTILDQIVYAKLAKEHTRNRVVKKEVTS